LAYHSTGVVLSRPGDVTKPRIAIVVPAYNEAANLPAVIADLQGEQCRRGDWVWRIIVVNDGSTDDTERLLDQLTADHGVVAVHCPVNVGIGAAVQAGFQVATEWGADVVMQVDGDGQHPPDQIAALAEPILAGQTDLAVGSRYVAGSGGAVSHVGRQVGTRLLSWLLRLVVGCRVKDVTSGFRAFSGEAARYVATYYPDDYPEVESYVPLSRVGFSIQEVPVQMSRRTGGRSSITLLLSPYYVIKVTLAVLIHLIRAIPERRREDRDP